LISRCVRGKTDPLVSFGGETRYIFRLKHEISHRVKDWTALIKLEGANLVGAVNMHNTCAAIDRLVSKSPKPFSLPVGMDRDDDNIGVGDRLGYGFQMAFASARTGSRPPAKAISKLK
jgi:hypothetical protein